MPKRRELREKAESKINNAKFEKGGPLSLCGNEESPFIFMEYSRLLSMKYRVNGIEIPLDRKETAAAKRMVAKFMEEVEKNSKDTGNTSLYFTTLILMQVLSQEALDHIDSETLQKYMEACEKKRKESLPD